MKRITIIGATGYVGSEMVKAVRESEYKAHVVSRTTVNRVDLEYQLLKTDLVINCAGFVGKPNVDACEGREKELHVSNVLLVSRLRKICDNLEIPLAHVSSGCIFQGYPEHGNGWSEDDPPNFDGSAYAKSKLMGEMELAGMERAWIFRPRMPFCGHRTDRNLIWKLRRYPTIVDALNSVTSLTDFCKCVIRAFRKQANFGIYNMCHATPITNREIVEMMQERGARGSADFVSAEDFNETAKAVRSFTTLNSEKSRERGIGLVKSPKKALEKSLDLMGFRIDIKSETG